MVVSRFQAVKEQCNPEFRLQEAKTHSRCLLNASWLEPYAWEGSTLLSNCGAVKLHAPVEEGAVPSETCVAKLGGSSCNNVVPLGGHHGQVQALLDGPAASGVAVQAVGDGGNDLVGAFRGSGKKAYGHGTFTPVGELVLANTHLTIHIHAGSCCWGWSPGAMTGGGTLVLQSPALCGALSFLRAGEALHCCPGWGWVLLLGGTKFFKVSGDGQIYGQHLQYTASADLLVTPQQY